MASVSDKECWGGRKSTKMTRYSVIGGGGRAQKRFEFISMAQTAVVSLGPLILEASRSHSGTTQLVVLLWTNEQPCAETST